MRFLDPLPMYRIAFNQELPVVASVAFMARGRAFAAGESVDWRALGVTPQKVLDWWRAGMVAHPTKSVAEAAPIAVTPEPVKQPKRRRK